MLGENMKMLIGLLIKNVWWLLWEIDGGFPAYSKQEKYFLAWISNARDKVSFDSTAPSVFSMIERF